MNNQKNAATDQHGINSNTTNVVSTCGDSSVIDLKLSFKIAILYVNFAGNPYFRVRQKKKVLINRPPNVFFRN